jgi:hypothetical protein
LLGARTLTGGGLLPLDDSVADLWQSAGYGWRDIGLGFVGAADPFAAVLALLGSLTFWQPSFSLVLLYFLALPLAAVGAWMAASRLTERASLRTTAAVLWVLAPTFLSALAAGRPAAVLVHLLLPWLFFAGASAAKSWSASASAALLFAAVVACAPSLTPALLIGWLVCILVSGRAIMRFIGIPIPALALAAPLIWEQGSRGNWLSLLADPGAPVPGGTTSVLQLLGFPSGEFGGWLARLEGSPIPAGAVEIAVPLLLAPLAILAVVALFLSGSRSASFSLLAALLGFATAVLATHLFVVNVGATSIGVWPGAGLSLYWLGIVGAVVIALRSLKAYAIGPALIAGFALLIAAAPLATSVPLGTSAVAKGTDRTLPAFVSAEAQADPRVGTLELEPQPDGGIRATVVRGSDLTLNDQSTLYSTDTDLTGAEEKLAVLAGNLASRSGLDASEGLDQFGIRFVLLRPSTATESEVPADEADQPVAGIEEEDTERRTATALDGNAALTPVGDTAFGRLWRHDPGTDATGFGAIPANAGGTVGLFALLATVIVFGATVLLSIPTGAGSEAVRQANREAIRRVAKANASAKANARAKARAGGRSKPGRRRKVRGGPAPDTARANEATPIAEEQTSSPAETDGDLRAEPKERDDAH